MDNKDKILLQNAIHHWINLNQALADLKNSCYFGVNIWQISEEISEMSESIELLIDGVLGD